MKFPPKDSSSRPHIVMVRGQRRVKVVEGGEQIPDLPKKKKSSKSEFQGKLSHTSPAGKITSYFHNDQEEQNQEFPPRTSPRKHASTISILTQANVNVTKLSPHRIEMKTDEIQPHAPQPQVKKVGRARRKVMQEESKPESQNKLLTDYFPVRRSVRKTKKTVLEEIQKTFEEAVLSKREEGLGVHIFEGKGRGIVATREFVRGDFVVEYAGELISLDEAKKREAIYSRDQNMGCYMYYFSYKNNQYCIDATQESDRLGRLVNHSRSGNLSTKTVVVNGTPHLVLIAKETIRIGDELTYDYGDRSKESLRYHPWLAY